MVRRRGGVVYHLGLAPGEIPECVLLPGDPDRASEIASTWTTSEPLHEHREFRSFRGRYRGVPLGVVSAGIGGPSMAIVVEELARIGARTLIRVGSCGKVSPAVRHADLVISTAAARFDGASGAYAPLGFPAVADPDVFRALEAAARSQRVRFHTGITATVSTFYLEQGRPGFAGFLPASARGLPKLFRDLGIVNIEMECATLFTIASIHRLRAGALCTVYGDGANGDPLPAPAGPAIGVANEAAYRLSRATPPRPDGTGRDLR